MRKIRPSRLIIHNPRVWWVWILNHTLGLVLPINFIPSDEPAVVSDWIMLLLMFALIVALIMSIFQ